MTIILFLLILTALIFVHELGHFLAAKKSGIRVDEFAIGFPPKIFSWTRGETKYSINLIPFGGFVKIHGENPDEVALTGPDKERSFVNKSKPIQAFVLSAGILMNIIFAYFLFAGSFMLGVPSVNGTSEGEALYITAIAEASPAEIAGLQTGDKILKIESGEKKLEGKISPDALVSFIAEAKDGVRVTLERGEEMKEIEVLPKEGVVAGRLAIGIQMAEVSFEKLSFFKAFGKAFTTTGVVLKETVVGIAKFFFSIFTFQADLKGVSGPVGIASLVGDASRFGFGYLLSFAAVISINLAIINLVPFPALDGGRLLFVGLEALLRRKISIKVQNILNFAGFAFLMILMVVITFSDIKKLF
ncbi:MAG: regulator of sigma protease [Patescibacteria group bacterium]|jgi:regulator of sigma E protease|nr:regulator of sigma protease [Patescibacteria group bacterium]